MLKEIEEKILSSLAYDPATGIITWSQKSEGRIREGHEAGSMKCGYRAIRICGKSLYSHRVAWFITHRYWPDVVDHINGNRLDNRLVNLRDVSYLENAQNLASKDNKTGHHGVHHDIKTGRWIAKIWHKGRCIHLGSHDELDKAKKIRDAALQVYGFHENHCTR